VRIDSDIVDIPSAGTAVRILNTRDKIVWIRFTAPAANSGLTYVGDSAVSATNGYVLGAAGGVDATVEIDFRGEVSGSVTANLLYIDAASSGDDISWIAILR
jgi:hypothetical protein